MRSKQLSFRALRERYPEQDTLDDRAVITGSVDDGQDAPIDFQAEGVRFEAFGDTISVMADSA